MKYSREDLEGLREFAITDVQRQYLDAVIEHGSNAKAAKALGLHRTTVDYCIKRIVRQAARKGYAPKYDMTHVVPDGYAVRGTSTLYDKDGKPRAQWVKTREDLDRQMELMREAAEAFASELPKARPVALKKAPHDPDLLNCYVVTDYHLGAYAWHEETGEDWDTDIAERLLVDWFSAAIRGAPSAQTAILAQLGDFLHWDGLDAVTPTSKHLLDADTRFQRVVRVAIRALRQVITLLLQKYPHVYIIMAEGNHDPAGSVWMREMLASFYEREPRVTVDRNADIYYCYEHGRTSLFFHHGHRRQPSDVDDVFVAKYREVFGRTKHSYGHMGHKHSIEVKETNLMVVEQHRTLAAPDAYASRGGWISGREAKVITYHKEHGEVGRITVSPDMVSAGRR